MQHSLQVAVILLTSTNPLNAYLLRFAQMAIFRAVPESPFGGLGVYGELLKLGNLTE